MSELSKTDEASSSSISHEYTLNTSGSLDPFSSDVIDRVTGEQQGLPSPTPTRQTLHAVANRVQDIMRERKVASS